jgi:hypothetical protein
LYEDNIFAFVHLDTISRFHALLPSKHWNIIRSLEVRWHSKGVWQRIGDTFGFHLMQDEHDREMWKSVCQEIKSLKALRQFALVSDESWIAFSPDAVLYILAPLKDLSLESQWELRIPGSKETLSAISSTLREAGFDCHATKYWRGTRMIG